MIAHVLKEINSTHTWYIIPKLDIIELLPTYSLQQSNSSRSLIVCSHLVVSRYARLYDSRKWCITQFICLLGEKWSLELNSTPIKLQALLNYKSTPDKYIKYNDFHSEIMLLFWYSAAGRASL